MSAFQKSVRSDFMYRTAANQQRIKEHCDRLAAQGFYRNHTRRGDTPAQVRLQMERDRVIRSSVQPQRKG
jgi:hypothetical protein